MSRKLKVFFASLTLFSLLIPFSLADEEKEEYTEIEVVQQKTRFQKHVLFIYDCSGSMSRNKLDRAFTAFAMIAKQPIDEMEIALIAFDDQVLRWPGVAEEGIPKGWAGMPSQVAFKKAHKWLDGLDLGGGTSVLPALKQAFEEKRERISIVVISDGGFSDNVPPSFPGNAKVRKERSEDFFEWRLRYHKTYLLNLQDRRAKAKLDPIQVNCLGIGNIQKGSQEDQFMTALAIGGGGFYVREKIKEAEDRR
tara:strand:+ start:27971 stop:28723 length:753 start_codon:yes stop_codon:yes gene_type:complete